MTWFKRSFEQSPLAWLALACFLYAEYNLYQRGTELTNVCLALSAFVSLDGTSSTPKNSFEQAVRTCYDRSVD